jgi:hypothetical protein
MRSYDEWHDLYIDGDGEWSLTHPIAKCPSYPDGPEPGDTAYGCGTEDVMGVHGTEYPELAKLKEGHYRIRYWGETSPVDGEFEDGFDVEVAG